MNKDKEFALELALLLEKHNVYIASPNDSGDNKVFSYVEFQSRGGVNLMPKIKRCTVSAYDLRCYSGMSSKEANEIYRVHRDSNAII